MNPTSTPNSPKTHKRPLPPLDYHLKQPTSLKAGACLSCQLVKWDEDKEEWAPIHVGANKKTPILFLFYYGLGTTIL